MTAEKIIEIIRLVLKLVSWITEEMTRVKFENAGYQRAVAEQLALLNSNLNTLQQAINDASLATEEDRRRELEADT